MSDYNPKNPLIVQSDRSLLLEVDMPLAEDCREAIAPFAELVKSPEHVHTYRVTPLSLWNARAAGVTFEEIDAALETYSRFEVPRSLLTDIRDLVGRYGRLRLIRDGERLILESEDPVLIAEVRAHRSTRDLVREPLDACRVEVPLLHRGRLKQALVKLGWPAEDLAGYTAGALMKINLRETTRSGKPFVVREYQEDAANAYWMGGSAAGGSGVLVLPCGAGKTIVGIDLIARAQVQTLIVVTGIMAARQWKEELLDKTDLPEDFIGEYSGERKEVAPITIATYQVLTYRKRRRRKARPGEAPLEPPRKAKDEDDLKAFPNLDLFSRENWGLIIYDEVHLLPAPVFRITAEIQAKRRLGLTATLVREDGREDDVFSLIGPKRYDIPWRVLEKQGWIAQAICTEVRLELEQDQKMPYALAERRDKYRLASTNPAKLDCVSTLLQRHKDDHILVIGQYLDQLEEIRQRFEAPIITGKTANRERGRLYAAFRRGEIKLLVVSKVANFAIDLPDANVAIQVSGTFGSRQEEAQRLGRILRPKGGKPAHFYTLVTRDTVDQDYGTHRQLFLTEQGYRYEIIDAADLVSADQVDDVASKLLG